MNLCSSRRSFRATLRWQHFIVLMKRNADRSDTSPGLYQSKLEIQAVVFRLCHRNPKNRLLNTGGSAGCPATMETYNCAPALYVSCHHKMAHARSYASVIYRNTVTVTEKSP
jgi:hypothetical protein